MALAIVSIVPLFSGPLGRATHRGEFFLSSESEVGTAARSVSRRSGNLISFVGVTASHYFAATGRIVEFALKRWQGNRIKRAEG